MKTQYFVVGVAAIVLTSGAYFLAKQIERVDDASATDSQLDAMTDKGIVSSTPDQAYEESLDDSNLLETELPTYANEDGAIASWGELVRFRRIADCHEDFAMTISGDALPVTKCENDRLEIDHPYGVYTIAQLEQAAANDDAIAAYILAMRLSKESQHNRRKDANKYFVQSFRQTREPEIFRAILADLDVATATYKDGKLVADQFRNVYVLNKAGFQLGVIDDEVFAQIEKAKEDAVDINFAELDLEVERVVAYLGGEQ